MNQSISYKQFPKDHCILIFLNESELNHGLPTGNLGACAKSNIISQSQNIPIQVIISALKQHRATACASTWFQGKKFDIIWYTSQWCVKPHRIRELWV